MSKYKPDMSDMIPMLLLVPTTTMVSGVAKKTFDVEHGILFFGSFKSFGGTEHVVNGVYSIENTAKIATWYNPDIKSDCRVKLADSGDVYEILNDPEDVDMRHQFMKFTVRRVKGGA